MLGIFLVAFWLKQIKGHAVFYAALISELLVILIYKADVISFLWLNVVGAVLVIITGTVFQMLFAAYASHKIKMPPQID